MTRKLFSLSAALLLIILCACTVRSPELPAQNTQTSNAYPSTDPRKPVQPASGSDLLLPEPYSEDAQAALKRLTEEMSESGSVCALAFVDLVDPELSIAASVETYDLVSAGGCWELYPFLKEMTPAQCFAEGNSELYCLLTAEEGSLVTIEKAEMEHGEPTDRTTELYRGSPEGPIFFTADSNGRGASNIRLTVKTPAGRELSFYPGLYSNLGTLGETEGVLDFSVYANA